MDLDGVIIDSETLHARAKRETLNHFGIAYPDSIFADFRGRPDTAFFSYVADELCQGRFSAHTLNEFKWNHYSGIADQVELIPGVDRFIQTCRERYGKIALVTSARWRDVEIADRRLHFLSWFDEVIHGDHTEHHKPHPEPYLLAAQKTGIPATDLMVVEDAPNGIRAAVAAGCRVVGITTSFAEEVLFEAGAHCVGNNYAEVSRMLRKLRPAG
jgi:beta-phosphoglucomutase